MRLVAEYMSIGSLVLPGATWVSAILLVLSGVFGLMGLFQFYSNGTSIDPHKPQKTTALVTGGIYQYSRNPMYLALFFLLIAYASLLQNVLNLFLFPVFIWYINRYQIIPEEEVMEEKFAEEYREYKSKVHRWL